MRETVPSIDFFCLIFCVLSCGTVVKQEQLLTFLQDVYEKLIQN